MTGPAAVSLAANDPATARIFFHAGLLVTLFAGIAGLALLNPGNQAAPARRLLQFAAVLAGLPAVLAIPVFAAVGSAGVIDAYFEMVSCLTTTGASALQGLPAASAPIVNDLAVADVFTAGAAPLPEGVIFWRAQVAWMGGLMIWLAAAEIFAPLGAAGFEIVGQRRQFSGLAPTGSMGARGPDPRQRSAFRLAALYLVLTAALWGLLMLTGDPPVRRAHRRDVGAVDERHHRRRRLLCACRRPCRRNICLRVFGPGAVQSSGVDRALGNRTHRGHQ